MNWTSEPFNLCIREIPKWVLLQTVKTPDEMPHNAAFHQSTLYVMVKKMLRQKITIYFCKLLLDTSSYVQWTIQSLLYHTRRKSPLVYKGLKNSKLSLPLMRQSQQVVCFSRLLKRLRSLYGKQCGPRSDCSYRSSLFWVHAVCFYT